MREITAHKVNDCNEGLRIEVLDEPGGGGASHEYRISGFRDADHPLGVPASLTLSFQNGPIKEVGTNGVTHEALLAVVIDRLEGFQRGPFACLENGGALNHLRAALGILRARTEARIAREKGADRKHRFCTTQINVSGEIADRLIALGRVVRDEDLAESGRENEVHITVRYGLHGGEVTAADVRALVAGFGPVRYRLGRLGVFAGAAAGKDYDVLVVEVDSPDLHRLNRLLGRLPHTDTFPEYRPHCTVAYVRAGLGAVYAAAVPDLDLVGHAGSIAFSDRDGRQADVELLGPPSAAWALPAAAAPVLKRMKTFDESKVNRDHGQFSSAPGGGSAPPDDGEPGELTPRDLFDPDEAAAWDHARAVARHLDTFGHQGLTTERPARLAGRDRLRFEHHVLTALSELEGHASPYFAPKRPGGADATYFKVGKGDSVAEGRVSVRTRDGGFSLTFDHPRTGALTSVTLPADAPPGAIRAAVRVAHGKKPAVADLEALRRVRVRGGPREKGWRLPPAPVALRPRPRP